MKKLNFLVLILITMIASCSSKRPLSEEGNTIRKEKVAYLTALSIKEKTKGFELELLVGNISSDGIIFTKKSVACGKGQTQGIITKFANESGTDSTWSIGKDKNLYLSVGCKLMTKKIPGDYFLTIGKIHKNPKEDSMTVGETLANDITLKIQETGTAAGEVKAEQTPTPEATDKAVEERVK
jgi:hypothetical protein